MKLGDIILDLRKKKGLSQEQLGERIDVTRQTISNWELGETSPNPDQLKLLSKELNVSIDELLDNDIKSVIEEKVSNTEKLAGLILKLIKIFFISIIAIFILLIVGSFLYKSVRKTNSNSRRMEETIHCKLYGEEHSFGIVYDELTGRPFELGGDSYFADILDLGKYDDAHQIFNVINDYVKKNGGTCSMIEERDLNDIVSMSIKEGTLTSSSATVIIEEKEDYNIIYGEPFWIEKYDSKNNTYTKLDYSDENCAFNLPAYSATPDKPLELKQDWSCMYGKLSKGTYRLVKEVSYESDEPIDDDDIYLIWVEFEIE